ncbi:MAG TPA: HlyD family efflux transporter periplasmic adaptor subunit [Gemmataceae bacterium]|nr:HlyD family efflux transporter periplasmic adaptor subunit [Gemmataceae bacterium]
MKVNSVNRRRAWFRWPKTWAVLIVVAAASLGAAWKYSSARTPVETAPKPPAPPLDTISSLGRLEPRTRVIELTVPGDASMARVEELKVHEGERVTAGQILVVLDSHRQKKAAVREAETKLCVEKARLAQIKAGAKLGDLNAQEAAVRKCEVALCNSQADRERYQHAAKSASASELDKAKADLDKAKMDLEQARATLVSLREVRQVDVDLQEQQIASFEASLEHAKVDLEATLIRAPFAGTILKIHSWPGARVSDKGVLQIGDAAQMDAVAEVYEADIAKVKVGQQANVRVSSSGQVLTGEVAEIGQMIGRKDVLNNDPVADTDARVVEVRIRLTREDSLRVAGLTNARVEVQISLHEIKTE